MKEFPDRGGRLPYRLWYDEAEIEAIAAEMLRRAGHPTLPDSPAVDVDAFVELHLGLVPEYTWLPRGVLGATEFRADGTMRMQIAAELSDRAERDPRAETLLRSTVAHEAAHVLLHRVLFLTESRQLFGPGVTVRSELCRSVAFTRPGYQGEWWEWQANRGMAALLLPRDALDAWLAGREQAFPREPVTRRREAAARDFRVSVDAVRRRLAQVQALSASS